MFARTSTISLTGGQAFPVEVQASIIPGQLDIKIVGLPDHAVKESKDRIRSAIMSSGFEFPVRTIVVNLAPNDLPKMGAMCELAIAVAILCAAGQLNSDDFKNIVCLGSLSLDGKISFTRGVLPAAIMAHRASADTLLVPAHGSDELAYIPSVNCYRIESLAQLKDFSLNRLHRVTKRQYQSKQTSYAVDFAQIRGHRLAKEGLAYAVCGQHHTLLMGPPGAGKTMLCRAAQSILPPLTLEEALEVTQVYATYDRRLERLVRERPFRSPHHSASDAAMIGGGPIPQPGEITLAHKGILFLDELLEFQARTLQALREPLQEKKVFVSRARQAVEFAADFTLLAATNPCRCGRRFVYNNRCICKRDKDRNALQKIIGPFIDRITVEIEAPEQPLDLKEAGSKPSSWWHSRVAEARLRMLRRNGGIANGNLPVEMVMSAAARVSDFDTLIKHYSAELLLSNRAIINTLRLALTIMDFNERSTLTFDEIDKAMKFRMLYMARKMAAA